MPRFLPVNLQTLVDSHDQPYQVIDADRRVVAINTGCLDLLGIARHEALGEFCYRLNFGREQPCTAYGETCAHDEAFNCQGRIHRERNDCGSCKHVIHEIATPLPTTDGRLFLGKALHLQVRPGALPANPPGQSLAQIEQLEIRRLLAALAGNRRRVADRLGISERTLYRRLKQYGIA